MSDELKPAAPVVEAPAVKPAPAVDPDVVTMSPSKLKERLDETREATRQSLLKEFGFSSLSDGKKALAAFQTFQESQLTEQQKLAKERDDLKPRAEAAEKLGKKYAAAVEREFSRLPDAVREAIDEQAKGDPETREMLMSMFAKVGAGATAATSAASVPAGAAKPANAGATPPAPKPAAVRSRFDEWDELRKTRPAAAGAFFHTHKLEIERTRPVTA